MIANVTISGLPSTALFFGAITTTVLITVGAFFAILLLLGLRKSYKLKKENERLEAMNNKIAEEEDKPYRDFTEGHIYGGDN